MMKWAAVALLALFCTSAYGAIDDVDGDDEPEEKPFATEITPDNYEELIDASDEYWMVEFFAPWCGHCKKLAPEWEKAAKQLAGVVKLGTLDADEHKEFASQFNIQGFPTILAFPNSAELNPYTKKFARVQQVYNGARTAKGIVAYAKNTLPSAVTELVGEGDISTFMGEKGIPKAVLFSEKKDVAPTFKALSLRFKDRLRLGQVQSDNEKLVTKYGVKKFPQVVLVPAEGDFSLYDGENKLEPLHAFFSKHANANKPKTAGAPSMVKSLTEAEFQSEVMTSNLTYIAEFHDGSTRAAAVTKVAKAMRGMGIEFVDVTLGKDSKLVGKLKLGKLPAVVSFGADDKDDTEKFDGEADSVDALTKFAEGTVPSAVEQVGVTGLQMLFQSNPTTPKILLFTKKDGPIPAAFKASSMLFKGKLMFASVANPPAQVLQQFNIPSKGKWPKMVAMFVVMDEQEKPKEGEEAAAKLQGAIFQGDTNKFDAMATWLGQFAAMDDKGESASTARGAPPLVNDQAGWKKHCTDKGGLCVVGFLDGSEEEKQREAKVDMLTKVSQKDDFKHFNFVWVDAMCQTAFAEAFNVQATKVPTVVVLGVKKLRYAEMVGRFEDEAIRSFLRGMLTGKVGTGPISELPSLASLDCAELHKANAAANVAPEEDLDDDIMREMRAEAEAKEKAAAEEEGGGSKKGKKKKKKKSEL